MRLPSLLCLFASLLLLGACGESAAPAATATAPAQEQDVHEWKMITSWPKNLPAVGTSPEEFSRRVERMTNGRLLIRVYGANELVGGLEVFDAVSQGVAEMGHSGAYYWQGKIAATPFFSSIPFGLTGSEQDAWLSYGGGNSGACRQQHPHQHHRNSQPARQAGENRLHAFEQFFGYAGFFQHRAHEDEQGHGIEILINEDAVDAVRDQAEKGVVEDSGGQTQASEQQ